ncbi:uncharacterized protein K452DRAFT_232970 [Aplosporella prunicola CBS 121167]|uniref:Glutathione S-transferase n=1 Tax=Aplosporella prunicola CBS 121167 TaxID=1176127 RepID=A0A6A6B4C2_9PEZI|nr:uncharacterized protein K452DRAFT_232970 [Aplosporella prunicola CBS 121167]KAF2139069.1 hypothetical protein K452DRAFT_232970 [Aplosporella prunicola CBS 121167]
MSQRPSGLIANKGIELLTFETPNGHKASIMLEELKEKYGLEYTFQSINILQGIQKEPWFTKLGPNGRVPLIVDHDNEGFAVQEGASILSYLTRHYDPEKEFTFEDANDLSRMEQWVAWQHGGIGPTQGQAHHYYRFAKEYVPYAMQRYVGETERLYGVLDSQLKDRDFIVGPERGKYSIADIANFSWVNVSYLAGVDVKQFPNVERWWKCVNERPAVQRGTAVPHPSEYVNKRYLERLEEDPEFKKQEDQLKEACRKAKEQYGYKYSSP